MGKVVSKDERGQSMGGVVGREGSACWGDQGQGAGAGAGKGNVTKGLEAMAKVCVSL